MRETSTGGACPFSATKARARRPLKRSANRSPLPPGPRGHWLLGALPQIQKDPLGFHLGLRDQYGDVASYRFLSQFSVAIHHPHDIEHVLVHNYDNYAKAVLRGGPLEDLMSNGILASNGDLWRRQRRTAQRAFTPERVRDMSRAVTTVARDTVERWRNEHVRATDVAFEMSRVTIDITGKTLFNQEMDPDAGEIADAFEVLLERGALPSSARLLRLLIWRAAPFLPRPRDVTFERAYSRLAVLVDEIVAKRLADEHRHDDLLSRIVFSQPADSDHPHSKKQLRDELISMLLAGYTTTANVLNWTWFLLAENPRVEARLHDEVDRVLENGRAACYGDLVRLKCTTRILQESMRLFPPAPIFPRLAIDKDEVGGYQIPAGAFVIISPYAVHRHPRYWPNPDRFDPDRFLPQVAVQRPPLAYIPFSTGPRRCLGHEFAVIEGTIIAATLARHFRFRLTSNQAVEVNTGAGVLRPRGGLPMVIEPRKSFGHIDETRHA